MKRNRGGERDLDHIILAAIRGLDRASLEYPQVRAGLILMMDRTFSHRQNEVTVEKAIRWASRGIVGIDIAGPRPGGERYDYTQITPMVEAARTAGLGVTIHVGEEGETGAEELGEVVEHLRPDRIGHGILAARDPELMRLLREVGHGARDLPDLEPAHEGAAGRVAYARRSAPSPTTAWPSRSPPLARDDANPPARRARAAGEDRRAHGERSRHQGDHVATRSASTAPRQPRTRAAARRSIRSTRPTKGWNPTITLAAPATKLERTLTS